MTRAVQITPARWNVVRNGVILAYINARVNETSLDGEPLIRDWWVNPCTSVHSPSRNDHPTAKRAVQACGWLKIDEWVPLPQPPTGVAEAVSATFMRSATTGKLVEVDVVDGAVVEVPNRQRCPDCGGIVASIFDHVDGCPDDCKLCGKPNRDTPESYGTNHRACEQREAMEADLG